MKEKVSMHEKARDMRKLTTPKGTWRDDVPGDAAGPTTALILPALGVGHAACGF